MIHAHDNGGVEDNHSPPGDGKIDWEKFIRNPTEVRFRGAFILEMAGNNELRFVSVLRRLRGLAPLIRHVIENGDSHAADAQ
jgi:sugar phosphate isomerase/epimerase